MFRYHHRSLSWQHEYDRVQIGHGADSPSPLLVEHQHLEVGQTAAPGERRPLGHDVQPDSLVVDEGPVKGPVVRVSPCATLRSGCNVIQLELVAAETNHNRLTSLDTQQDTTDKGRVIIMSVQFHSMVFRVNDSSFSSV